VFIRHRRGRTESRPTREPWSPKGVKATTTIAGGTLSPPRSETPFVCAGSGQHRHASPGMARRGTGPSFPRCHYAGVGDQPKPLRTRVGRSTRCAQVARGQQSAPRPRRRSNGVALTCCFLLTIPARGWPIYHTNESTDHSPAPCGAYLASQGRASCGLPCALGRRQQPGRHVPATRRGGMTPPLHRFFALPLTWPWPP
jgi:hypothetical protein